MSSVFIKGKGKRRKLYIRWKNALGVWERAVTAYANKSEALEEARRRELEAQETRAGKKRPQKRDISVRAAVQDEYLPSLPPGYVSKNSLEGRFRNRILPVKVDGVRTFGDLLCRAEVDGGHVKKVIAANTDCSPATREQLRVAIQGLFTFLIQAKRADENPAAGVTRVRVPKKKPKFLRPADIPLFIAAVPEDRRLQFAFNLGTGARKQESLELAWPDVHEEEGYAVLDKTKTNEGRMVPLPEWLCLMLRVRRTLAESRWVFPIPEGLKNAGEKQPKWVAFHRMVKAALRKGGLIEGYLAKCVTRGQMKPCGFRTERASLGTVVCPSCDQASLQVTAIPIPITFHNLRSTWATYAYAHTRDIRFVQLVLGHSDARVTARYAAVIDEHMRMMANRVQLNPFAAPALPSESGTPVGHGESNGVHVTAFQNSAVLTKTSGGTSDTTPSDA